MVVMLIENNSNTSARLSEEISYHSSQAAYYKAQSVSALHEYDLCFSRAEHHINETKKAAYHLNELTKAEDARVL